MEHNIPIGTIDIPTGADKPRMFLSIDPRMFLPIGLFIVLGVFANNLPLSALMYVCAALSWGAGILMGMISPYFLDEFSRWADWRLRTGNGPMPANGYYDIEKSPHVTKWRPL